MRNERRLRRERRGGLGKNSFLDVLRLDKAESPLYGFALTASVCCFQCKKHVEQKSSVANWSQILDSWEFHVVIRGDASASSRIPHPTTTLEIFVGDAKGHKKLMPSESMEDIKVTNHRKRIGHAPKSEGASSSTGLSEGDTESELLQ